MNRLTRREAGEILGAVLIIIGAGMFHPALGVLLAGIALVLMVNLEELIGTTEPAEEAEDANAGRR